MCDLGWNSWNTCIWPASICSVSACTSHMACAFHSPALTGQSAPLTWRLTFPRTNIIRDKCTIFEGSCNLISETFSVTFATFYYLQRTIPDSMYKRTTQRDKYQETWVHRSHLGDLLPQQKATSVWTCGLDLGPTLGQTSNLLYPHMRKGLISPTNSSSQQRRQLSRDGIFVSK